MDAPLVQSRPAPPTPDPGRRHEAQRLSMLPPNRLYAMLTPARRRAVIDLIDRLLRFRPDRRAETMIKEFCSRLNDMGVPVDRYGSSTSVLMPEHDAIGRLWTREKGVEENVYVRPPGEDSNYLKSPLYEAAALEEWVELWLPETPAERFGIVPELKQDGYVHYICMPFRLSNDANGWITMATKAWAGFTAEDFAVFALVYPAITRMIDTRVGWMTLDRLLRIYVGDEPHRAILDGNVKRGQVSTIRSAILFADMRDSTGHTAEISAVQAVELFNQVFDNLVPPIEQRRGEVLKYIGDGLLAIFRDGVEADCDPAAQALAAAEEAQANLARFNEGRVGKRLVEVGIALHFGEAAYGNVGSGQRLDFTVVGRDVGLASRIGSLNARLGEPLLLSQAFVERLKRPVLPLGAFTARGFSTPIAVFRPLEETTS